VAVTRGVKVYEVSDLDAMGLIDDIPTVGDLIAHTVDEAEELITGRVAETVEENVA